MIIPDRSFLAFPIVSDLTRLDADVVVPGIPHGVPYVVDDEQRGLVEAPAAVRAASRQFVDNVAHHHFDLGHAFVRDGRPRLVDAGDVPYQLGDGEGNARRAGEALAQIVARDAMPLSSAGTTRSRRWSPVRSPSGTASMS